MATEKIFHALLLASYVLASAAYITVHEQNQTGMFH